MKAIVWRESAGVEEVAQPQARDDEFLVRVRCASICGSDLTIIAGKHLRARPPLILGHEFMGVVAQAPRGLEDELPVGTRVVVEPLLSCKVCRPCRRGFEHVCEKLRLLGVEADGGFAEFVAAPKGRVYPLPDGISDEEAALVEPLAVAVHAVDLARVEAGDRAVILGAGPIGLLVAQVLRAGGSSKVWLSEVDPYRLELARSLGFATIDAAQTDPVQAALDLTGGYGADVAFDAAGVPATGAQATLVTGIKGRIVMVAIHKKPCEIDLRPLAYRELTILGSRIYAAGDFTQAIALVAGRQVQLRPLITHVFDLAACQEAFAVARRGTGCCKVLLKP